MAYPYGGPYNLYQPPPPPPHPNLMDPAFNGLNVSDPRFAAKYGNPYLRSQPEMSPQMTTRNYQFATLNRGYTGAPASPNLQGFSTTGQRKKVNVNYAGTMIGNGKSSSNGKTNGQYIVSPESDAKGDAMATHV